MCRVIPITSVEVEQWGGGVVSAKRWSSSKCQGFHNPCIYLIRYFDPIDQHEIAKNHKEMELNESATSGCFAVVRIGGITKLPVL